MVASVTFNPYQQVSAPGTFNLDSTGYVQGMALDQPAVRYQLRGGVLALSESLPMWGGVAITELIPSGAGAGSFENAMGPTIKRATAVPVNPYTATTTTGLITGFSVFDQNYSGVATPQGQVPITMGGGQVNFYPLGSGAVIPVAVDPVLASLILGPNYYEVSWDFNNSRLQPYDASTATYALTSMTWASTNGGQFTVVGAVASPVGAVGDVVFVSGATNSGTGGNAWANGPFTVVAFTDNEHYVLAAPAPAGVIATIAGSPVLNYGTGLLPCRIENLLLNNSMTVAWNPVTQVASWNRADSVALIRI